MLLALHLGCINIFAFQWDLQIALMYSNQSCTLYSNFTDDIGIFTNSSFTQHLTIVHQVLLRLEESCFTVNPLKSVWTVQATDYLDFLLTTEGIKPLPTKIEAISRIARPTAPTHAQSFVGLIYYYRDL